MKKLIFCFILLISTSHLFANSIDDKKNQINKIDNEIKKKGDEIKNNTQMIKTIDKKTETTKEQITRIKKELKSIENDKQELKEKIKIVSRKIDYGKRNLNFSSKELTLVENNYVAMLQAWQKKDITNNEDIHNFKIILQSNENRQDEIKSVQQNINAVKSDIETEQKQLKTLQTQLASKQRQQVNKNKDLNNLILKYNNDKKTTIAKTNNAKTSITSLQKEKSDIEKEIDNIIKTRTKQIGNVKYETISQNLGDFKKPISGKTIINFNETKIGGIKSSGQEISGELGDRVISANEGTVIYSGEFMNMGKIVMVDHGYNLITIYGNLITSYVKLNEKVKKGSDIGILGLNLDGNSHLYYEIRFNLKPSDPNNF